ncbi:MAG: cupin-like domain-containing protein [Erythrobacter sp.]|uniref:cupin-like domain-containing protein n=1 Tax=Erythrobacter sp. TaxID=1042 RepID=UPI003298A2EB
MNAQAPRFTPAAMGVFEPHARDTFIQHYPEGPHSLRHNLGLHPLLELDALAGLGELLPAGSIEYNRGDLPIGVDGKPGSNGLSIGDTIRTIAKSNSWAVLKNIEQTDAYKALLSDLLDEIRNEIEAKTGKLLTPQGYIFISSPNAVTPYHFDPEHNILLQIRGSKAMTQFPAGNARFASDKVHESYHTGGPRELQWDESFMDEAREFPLGPGDAVFVPVMAPHFVRNGPESSISLSITWRSEWSYSESEARAFNGVMRKAGLHPKAPGRWPKSNRAKSLGYRALRKVGLTQA